MYKNKLFILMYCIPMIPTGKHFQFFIFYALHQTRRNFCGKFIFHVELQRKKLIKCSTTLVVHAQAESRYTLNEAQHAQAESRCTPKWVVARASRVAVHAKMSRSMCKQGRGARQNESQHAQAESRYTQNEAQPAQAESISPIESIRDLLLFHRDRPKVHRDLRFQPRLHYFNLEYSPFRRFELRSDLSYPSYVPTVFLNIGDSEA